MDFIESCSVMLDHKSFGPAAAKLRELVESGCSELNLQKHLEEYPFLLSRQFSHCHHIAPQVKLGTTFVTDFMCFNYPSHWPHWVGVEIESPQMALMTKAGRRSAKLEHALQQIRDWRNWVGENLNYAQKPKTKGGLGLDYLDANFEGLIVAGRRPADEGKFQQIRNQIHSAERIRVFTWDGFVEHAEKQAEFWGGMENGFQIDLGDGKPIHLIPIDDDKS